jgi:hypothetical protein
MSHMQKPTAKPEHDDMVQPDDQVAHDKWARRKIEHALKQADAHPDKRIPQAEVWRRFGIEN